MRRIIYIEWLCLLFIVLNFNVSCTDSKDSAKGGDGITDQSWTTGQTYKINAGQTLTFNFTALGSWTARSSSNALLTLNTNAGSSGKSSLSVTAQTSSQKQATVIIQVSGYSSNTTIKIELTNNAVTDKEINYHVDQYLKEAYLWNGEYKTLTPNFTQAYDAFLENTLMSMRTNTLDKKPNNDGTGGYSLFSYIRKLDPNLQSTARSAKEPKRLEYNYGIVNLLILVDQFDNYSFATKGVYPGSSADKTGIKRGTEIVRVNNQKITESNYLSAAYSLVQPTSASTIEVTDYNGKTYTINSAPIYANPILYHHVKNEIGYLVYNSFEAGFDQELFDVFKEFKSQNISDLILDLRYNGGGHVMSANLIASCIAGAQCNNKTFTEYRYNDERMRALNNIRPAEKFAYSSYENLGSISLSPGDLNLSRIYCLVSNASASASELVINSLRGIGVDVILIGTPTRGKNVGMEGVELTTATAKYELYPITFQSYNALGEGDYQNGFTPNFIINENGKDNEPFLGYSDFGTSGDVLYAKAMSLITGNAFAAPTSTRSVSRSSGIAMQSVEKGFIGMIK